MRKKQQHGLPLRRKRQSKTDYRRRLRLLKSKKLRLVVRISSKNVLAQVVEYQENGDKVMVSAYSRELTKQYGWNIARRNTPCAYLTGYLLGTKAVKKNLKEAVVDLGLQKPIRGSLLFAVVKGAQDAGLQLPCSSEVFPSEERLKGKHIKNVPFDQVLGAIKTKAK